MLHTAESSWSREPADLTQLAMAPTAIDVSMSAPVALQEASLTPVATVWSQPAAGSNAPEAAGGLDTAMMAMALVSAWMVLAGAALLFRHVRITRIEATQL